MCKPHRNILFKFSQYPTMYFPIRCRSSRRILYTHMRTFAISWKFFHFVWKILLYLREYLFSVFYSSYSIIFLFTVFCLTLCYSLDKLLSYLFSLFYLSRYINVLLLLICHYVFYVFSVDCWNPCNFKYGRPNIEPCDTHYSEFRRLSNGLGTEMFTLSAEGYPHSESTLYIQHGLRYLQTFPSGTCFDDHLSTSSHFTRTPLRFPRRLRPKAYFYIVREFLRSYENKKQLLFVASNLPTRVKSSSSGRKESEIET